MFLISTFCRKTSITQRPFFFDGILVFFITLTLYTLYMDRTILHCDMNGFFASVELLDLPELRDQPMAVCGNPKNRHGIIVAKNEIAKAAGVKTAETIWQARKKCPGLKVVPPHHEKYNFYCKLINDIYYRYTDLVEPFSIDESWLDVTASRQLLGTGSEIADQIRSTIKNELDLTLSVGVSFNKIFAKMGSEYKKPDATTVITQDNYREILWPLPVEELFFVGRVMTEKFNRLRIQTIGDLACYDKNTIISQFGKHGAMVHDYANGLDKEEVSLATERRKIKSVGNGITFKRDLVSDEDVLTAIVALSDTVASRLRQYRMKASGVKVEIKDPAFQTLHRQKQLDTPTNLAIEIKKAALELTANARMQKQPIRLLTITAINLSDEGEDEQISLFHSLDSKLKDAEKLERTLDKIRSKYGIGAVNYGQVLQNDIGIDLEEIREEE